MPYIPQERRKQIDPTSCMSSDYPATAGELNFVLIKAVLQYLKDKGESYQTYNDCLGALTACQMELYRRRIAGYEDGKASTNGDVF